MAQELKAEWGRSLPGDLLKRWPRRCGRRTGAPGAADQVHGRGYGRRAAGQYAGGLWHPLPEKLPGDGQFGKIMLGMSGYGVEILVPETLLADAQALQEGCAEALTEGDDNA